MTVAKLLTSSTNYAVVQLPDRKFPGVVIPGDSLHNLIGLIETAQNTDLDREGLMLEALQILRSAQSRYEKTCIEHGITPPYYKS